MKNRVSGEQSIFYKKYEKLRSYTSDIVMTVNPDGEVIEANEKAFYVFGSSLDGVNIQDIFDGVDPFFDFELDNNVVRSNYVLYKTGDGEKHPFKLTFAPVLEKGKVNEIIVICNDLKEIESFRKEIEYLKERLKAIENKKRKQTVRSTANDNNNEIGPAARKVDNASKKLEEMNRNMLKELKLASILQKTLIPSHFPADDLLQFTMHFEPTGFVGGDYYDIIGLGDNKKGVIIADVSGHGVSSAFIAAMLKISFMNFAAESLSPAGLLNRLNKEYCSLIQTGDFVTAIYAIFDPVNSTIVYSGAGHPKPLLLHRKTGAIEFLRSNGFFIGMFEGAEYKDRTVEFSVGDRYLAYTDGIIEAHSEDQMEIFGSKRLLASFEMCRDKPCDIMINSIIRNVKKFMQKSKFYDDLAMVAVEYKNKGQL